ncbi:MAG: tetratricopeptide repeat protein [Betaproteobacteria bacterium]|nr:tetratricopeptide repeat protein [Betaproteobacteria bacterium]
MAESGVHNIFQALEQGDHPLAAQRARSRLADHPTDGEAWFLLGIAERALGDPRAAAESYRRALVTHDAHADVWFNLGNALLDCEEQAPALEAFAQAVARQPDHSRALQQIVRLAGILGRADVAEAATAKLLALEPDNVDILTSRLRSLREAGRWNEALTLFQGSLPRGLEHAGFLMEGRRSWSTRGDYRALAVLFERLDQLQPGNALVKFHLGLNRLRIQQNSAAIGPLREAEALGLKERALFVNLGTALARLDQVDEALRYLEQAVPEYHLDPSAYVYTFALKQKLCDWRGHDTLKERLLDPVLAPAKADAYPALPFPLTAYPGPIDEAQQLVIARRFAAFVSRGIVPFESHPWTGTHKRIRVGYLSADFHDHATAHLMLGMFKRHDKSRFEVFAYSYGIEDGSDYRRRIKAEVEHFVDLAPLTDRDAARRIHADEIDVLVDLKGYTREARTAILAYCPSPVQVAWLGYPGSMGAAYIDYALVDATVVPPSQQVHYSERLLYMPHTYQVNDDEQAIDPDVPTRADAGLPARALVFCCFCAHYKIDPTIFDAWMRILKAVPGSVLWLIDGYEAARRNLRAAAEAAGVDPKRLIFAPREKKARHLARHRLADLFLDTWAYNAHTTMSDALWAGLPAITCPGQTFARRVGASLLKACGLEELIAPDLDAYVRMAVDLARDRKRRDALRETLAARRLTAPLFDTAGFVRDWEARLVEVAPVAKDDRERRQREEALMMGALQALDRDENAQAVTALEPLLDAGCDRPDAWNLYAVALRRQKRFDLASLAYRRGIGLKPDYAEMIGNYANLLREQDHIEESLPLYREAVRLAPRNRPALTNLAAALAAYGRPEPQLMALSVAEDLEPDNPDTHWDKALALLMMGRLRDGLQEYEWRYRRNQPPKREYPQPLWKGELLHGRRIFLHWEQGYGDVIQFLRFVPLVVAAGGQVVLEVQPGLKRLVSGIDGVVDVIEAPAQPPAFDVWQSLLSVPLVLGIDETTLPAECPYVHAPDDLRVHWRKRLGAKSTRPRIGLVWAGNPNVKNDRLRSPRLSPLLPLLDFKDVDWVLLQQGDGRKDLEGLRLPSNVRDFGVEAKDFADTAAIMSELDLVISSDTSTAHLAAALGCPTWVLLHYASDWRWGLGDSTPWYPQARLFRQAQYARWDGVVKQVRDALLDTFDVAKPKVPRKHASPATTAEEVPPMLAEAFALYRKGSPHLARMAARAALGTHPQRPDAWCLLGVVERALGDAEAAERAYRKAIELLPGYGDAWFNLGNLHRGARRLEQAKAAYEEVIRQQPAHAQALSLLSDVMRELQDLPAAERLARTAVDTQPEFAEAWGHLGNALNDLERFDEAAQCYERALQLPNPPAETHYNKGVALQRAGHVVESIECYRTILAAKPAEVNAHYNLATALLTLGQFEEGFREYEWRLQKPDLRERTYAQPAWRGESLAGKRILLYWEQGYGDTLQFLRFLPLLAERGARIVLELQAGLKTLAAPLPGVEAVFDAGETLPPFDVHAPLISVPARLGLDAGRLPSRIPYLSVPAELTARWRLRLGRKEKPLRVGLVWGGNPNVRSDRVRSPRLKPLLPLIRIPGIQWIVLQQGDGRRDLEALRPEGDVLDIAPEVRDFADTGAIMNSLDMMISSDTSTAHLAAALGVPTWALLHYAADWRWMEGEGTVWYPELRAFRQRAPGAWDEVVSRVGKALETATRPTQRERVPA